MAGRLVHFAFTRPTARSGSPSHPHSKRNCLSLSAKAKYTLSGGGRGTPLRLALVCYEAFLAATSISTLLNTFQNAKNSTVLLKKLHFQPKSSISEAYVCFTLGNFFQLLPSPAPGGRAKVDFLTTLFASTTPFHTSKPPKTRGNVLIRHNNSKTTLRSTPGSTYLRAQQSRLRRNPTPLRRVPLGVGERSLI